MLIYMQRILVVLKVVSTIHAIDTDVLEMLRTLQTRTQDEMGRSNYVVTLAVMFCANLHATYSCCTQGGKYYSFI